MYNKYGKQVIVLCVIFLKYIENKIQQLQHYFVQNLSNIIRFVVQFSKYYVYLGFDKKKKKEFEYVIYLFLMSYINKQQISYTYFCSSNAFLRFKFKILCDSKTEQNFIYRILALKHILYEFVTNKMEIYLVKKIDAGRSA